MPLEERLMVQEERRIRRVLEDVYVRDMYMKGSRNALSQEFDTAFHMLVPELDGRSGEPIALHWDGLTELQENHPKAILAEVRFEFPFIDVVGDAAVGRVDVYQENVPVYSDYVSLYRIGGQWKLVSKVFHRHGTRPDIAQVDPTSEKDRPTRLRHEPWG